MKKLFTIILLLLSSYTYAQIGVGTQRTNGNPMAKDSALFIGKLKIPSFVTPSLGGYQDRFGQSFGVLTGSKMLSVRGSSVWLYYPDLTKVQTKVDSVGGLIGSGASNLALGTATTTTQPITNSNGTGVTLPSVVAGVSAGLMGSADKTKLDAITGTNTGNQTISNSGVPGNVTLSASGGSVTLSSIFKTTDVDANTLPTNSGLFSYLNTTGSTNYPSTVGAGIRSARTGSSAIGYFEIWKSNTSADDLYFRTGSGTSTFNAFDIIAGRTWTAGQYVNLTTAQTVAGQKQFTDIFSSGNVNVQGQINANPSTDARAGVVATANSGSSTGALFWGRTSAGGTVFQVSPSGITTGSQYRLTALNTAPASATATGTLGEIRVTADFIYVCIASNTWVRSQLLTW